MANEKDFNVVCQNASLAASSYNQLSISIEGANVRKFIEDLPEDVYKEVVEFVWRNNSPEEVFPETDLAKWAEANGYTKENN